VSVSAAGAAETTVATAIQAPKTICFIAPAPCRFYIRYQAHTIVPQQLL
jgi:hypothetical protein